MAPPAGYLFLEGRQIGDQSTHVVPLRMRAGRRSMYRIIADGTVLFVMLGTHGIFRIQWHMYEYFILQYCWPNVRCTAHVVGQ